MQDWTHWLVSVVYLALLTLELLIILSGFIGCFGFRVKSRLVMSGNVDNSESMCWNSQFTVLRLLSVSVLMAMMSTGATLAQKLFVAAPGMKSGPPVCLAICSGNIAFYGVSKLLIFALLYFKAHTMCECYIEPDLARKRLTALVSVLSLFYSIAIVMNVVSPSSVSLIISQSCFCGTGAWESAVFLACDWSLSLSLFGYFLRPRILRIRNRRWSEQQILPLLKSAAVEYFGAAFISLIIAPAFVAYYVWSNFQGSVTTDPLRRNFALLKIDLVLSCWAQLYVCRRLWERSTGSDEERDFDNQAERQASKFSKARFLLERAEKEPPQQHLGVLQSPSGQETKNSEENSQRDLEPLSSIAVKESFVPKPTRSTVAHPGQQQPSRSNSVDLLSKTS
jgi:hypothetical protein